MQTNSKKTVLLALVLIANLLLISVASSTTIPTIPLTSEELTFIETHPIINLAVDPQFYPYEFFDSDGNYKGIAADYIHLISKKTGLQFKMAQDLTWESAYEKAVLGELDGLSCVLKTKTRESYFLFSEPYYDTYRAIFVNRENKTIHNFDDLKGKNVAVQKNSSHHSYLADYPDIHLNIYTTVEDALKAVSNKKSDAFVGNFATSTFISKEIGITNLNYITIADQLPQSLHFAIRKDWPELVSIINKALADITKEEQITINNTWIGVDSKVNYQEIYRIAGIIGLLVLLVLIVSFFWIIKLKKEVKLRKQIEADLKVAKDDAELANQVKSIFLARMSHEIRTPLNAITGMSYILHRTELSTTQKLYLEKITRASRDMLSIINDILDFSKIEAGKIELESIPFNLDETIEQVINIASHKIEEQRIQFSMHKDTQIPTFFLGDPKKIGQVLLNVVNNALKFTKDGEVSLLIRLVAKVKDNYIIEFSVKDTGIGMSEEQLQHLFVPFNQADSSISRRFGGTGLGMSIVKTFVELMQGKIEVFSELGVGSTFNIQLPLAMDYNKDYEKRKADAALYFKNIRALVYDASFFYSNLLKEYLQSFNIIADFAQTEERTIEFLEKANQSGSTPYNLLIIDYESPSMNGIEFCKKLKQLTPADEFPKTILLVPLSRVDLFDTLEVAELNLGIAKPIIPSVLYNGIVELFKINILEIHSENAQYIKERPLGDMDETIDPDNMDPQPNEPYQILVVEDNLTNQFIAKSLLEQCGYQVILTENGQVGVDYYRAHPDDIQLILMDLHMPVLNGYEASAQIRAIDRQVPIIAMTADAITGVEEKCRASGITHFITKPFEPEDFIRKVRSILKNLNQEMSLSSVTGDTVRHAALDFEKGLKSVGGNKDLYMMVLKTYFTENQNVGKSLESAINSHAYDEAFQIVHKIKSSSGSIGANAVHEMAATLQTALKDVKEDQIEELTTPFIKLVRTVLDEIDVLCNAD
ncbi:response regulator [Fusibacter ferrireducens]|uniref:Stage 0 sporulation protein A homolog n=1 Tax=Fusibacter ferrireducens TaxID=2785058 RepID=A0ABR9ZVG9_9FIRM|nr:transporter substrate-binding domain-containing protein [Fusibacter ferrireducens]MBF4694415.1 transporter substrate-binding domain-containing protein [Fusibacter ferrireducens]